MWLHLMSDHVTCLPKAPYMRFFINNTQRLKFCSLKISCFLPPHYDPKVIRHILKNL